MIVNSAIVIKTTKIGAFGFFTYAMHDVEIVTLLIIGTVASVLSFFYDMSHNQVDTKFDMKSVTELLKYILYGVSVMIMAYFLLEKATVAYEFYIDEIVLGAVATLCSASAITLVDYLTTITKELIPNLLKRLFGLKEK